MDWFSHVKGAGEQQYPKTNRLEFFVANGVYLMRNRRKVMEGVAFSEEILVSEWEWLSKFVFVCCTPFFCGRLRLCVGVPERHHWFFGR